MTPSSGKPLDRRAFFRTLLRGAALGALAGTSWFLLARGQAGAQFRCVNDNDCRTCARVGQCPLNDGSPSGAAATENQP